MKKVDGLSRKDLSGLSPAAPDPPRPAPQAIKVLLPVWGAGYVRQFLDIGLPTLLAPGNVPALAAALPTEFIILTSLYDETTIREHAAFRRLAATCQTKLRLIDHLITDGNYSTTITIAYAESVIAAGESMLDTCFFFLVSDYIMADGSLANALKRMQCGASAVVVGNFQVAREEALPWLEDKLVAGGCELALPSRELMRWALGTLHPTAIANTVDNPFSHNSHANRLFWRVDGNTIQGRFYLMHMLCVRPEITNFIIGASCDYSFVPEMCPSGRVDAITDSDEYLVVEMQPRDHESTFLRLGPVDPQTVALGLNDWATKLHRENARYPIIFHAQELPRGLASSIEQADEFVDQTARRLTPKPSPYRGHPYWTGAIVAFMAAAGSGLAGHEWLFCPGLRADSKSFVARLWQRIRYVVMGRPPRVWPWHRLWPDFRTVLVEIEALSADRSARGLILSSESSFFARALAETGERVHCLRWPRFLSNPPEWYQTLRGKFDLCLIELCDTELGQLDKLMDRVVPLMKNGGQIVLFVIAEGVLRGTYSKFRDARSYVSDYGTRFARLGALMIAIRPIPASEFRGIAARGIGSLYARLRAGGWFAVPALIAGGGVLLCLSLIGNLEALRRSRRGALPNLASSVVMRLGVDVGSAVNHSLPDARHAESSISEDRAARTDEMASEAIEQVHDAR
jgi:hypothetical protein